MQRQNQDMNFYPINIQEKKKEPLTIYGVRFYYRLISKTGEYSRALTDDYYDLHRHVVICFTPEYLPDGTPSKNKKGLPRRLYTFFDSYLDLHNYIKLFPEEQRAFYEVIFGNLEQKPHFDIDISAEDVVKNYPEEDIINVGERVKDAVISSCVAVFQDVGKPLNVNDILLYSSHGSNKRSYHLVINNWKHSNNKEAKAFYEAVMVKFKQSTNNKYSQFIDSSVYGSKQQFRLVNCQKTGSGRPKKFHEEFIYGSVTYKHIYPDREDNGELKDLATLYESLVCFTSRCSPFPSLVVVNPKKIYEKVGDISDIIVNECMGMLDNTLKDSPFTLGKVDGNFINLVRNAPSHCIMCNKVHDNIHPYIFITNNNVYFDCRRTEQYNKGCKKIYLGTLGKSIIQREVKDVINIKGGFSGFDGFLPEEAIISKEDVLANNTAIEDDDLEERWEEHIELEKKRKEVIRGTIDVSTIKPMTLVETRYDPYDTEYYFNDYLRMCKYAPVFESREEMMNFIVTNLRRVVRIINGGTFIYYWKSGRSKPFDEGTSDYFEKYQTKRLKYKEIEEGKNGGEAKVIERTYPCTLPIKNTDDFITSGTVIWEPYHKDLPLSITDNNAFNIFPGFPVELVNVKVEPLDEQKLNTLTNFEDELAYVLSGDYGLLILIFRHIYEVWASGNKGDFCYQSTVLFYSLRTLIKSEKVLILTGCQGCGKSQILEFMYLFVYGENLGYSCDGFGNIFKQFNGSSADKMFINIDEVQTAEKQQNYDAAANKFKRLITAPKVSKENKRVNEVVINNRANYFVTSNNPHPVRVEAEDRRLVIYACSEHRVGDVKYFDDLAFLLGTHKVHVKESYEMGLKVANLLYTFIRSDRFKTWMVPIDKIPMTTAKQDNIVLSEPKAVTFMKKYSRGEAAIPEAYFEFHNNRAFAPICNLYELYKDWDKEDAPAAKTTNSSAFGKAFKATWKDVEHGEPRISNVKKSGYYFNEPLFDSIIISKLPGFNREQQNITLRQWLHSKNPKIYPLKSIEPNTSNGVL